METTYLVATTHGSYPLETRTISRTLNGRLVLDRIDIRIASGEVVALHGANGVGKTTLLRCLCGNLRPTSGEVLWYGISPVRQPMARRQVGFAGHQSFVYPELTVSENLLFAARMYATPNPETRVGQLLEHTGLEIYANVPSAKLSAGMRQRLAVARALVHEPAIVILDEPFTGLDAVGQEWVANCVSQLRLQGRAICFSSHDARQSQRLADRTLKLREGKLIAVGSKRKLQSAV